jgi:hypothetical protein
VTSEGVSQRGLIAGIVTILAIGVLYVSGYCVARATHVLVHREEWTSMESVDRIAAGDGSERLAVVPLVYAPMIALEERVRFRRYR